MTTPFLSTLNLFNNQSLNVNMGNISALAFDNNNMYVGSKNFANVFKVDRNGFVTIVAGNGTAGSSTGDGGLATAAVIQTNIRSLTIDNGGNLYIADTTNNKIRKIQASTGIISTYAGTGVAGYSGDGATAASAQLSAPTNIDLDSGGNLYIADSGNNVIRKVFGNGIISTFAGIKVPAGNVATSAALSPYGVFVDSANNIYIADTNNHRIRKVTASTGIISTVAGNGVAGYGGDNGNAISLTTALYFPNGVCVDSGGNIYIADYGNNRIRKVTASTGNISTVAGTGVASYGGDYGNAISTSTATITGLNNPRGIAIDGINNVYIADTNNNVIKAYGGGISVIAGIGSNTYTGDGNPAIIVNHNLPSGIAVDINNNVYVADTNNNKIKKINTSGIITTIAGNGRPMYGGDNQIPTAATVAVNKPSSVAVDNTGNIYISDTYNNVIRKIDITTNTIKTIAGNGQPMYGGDNQIPTATTVALNKPSNVAIDNTGNIYISDTNNNVIRQINQTSGLITTIAGNGQPMYGGDGGLANDQTLAALNNPSNIAIDSNNNIYITDQNNNVIREITASTNIINTISGNININTNGDYGYAINANIVLPQFVQVDNNNNIYISQSNNVIRMITNTGIITTIAGNSQAAGYSGDGQPGTSGLLNNPNGIAVDNQGQIYIADTNNNTIRTLTNRSIISKYKDNGNVDLDNYYSIKTSSTNCSVDFRINNNTGYSTSDGIDLMDRYQFSTMTSSTLPTGYIQNPTSINYNATQNNVPFAGLFNFK